MKPDELEIYITKLLQEKRPDIKKSEFDKIIKNAIKFCHTQESANAFIKGMS